MTSQKNEHEIIEWDDDLHGWIYCRGCTCYKSGDPDLYPYRKDNYKLDEVDY